MSGSNTFDIIVLAVLALSAFWGGARGMIAQLATIASWVVSWFVAARYYGITAKVLSLSDNSSPAIAPIVTFVVCAIAIGIGAQFVKKIVKVSGLKEFDRQVGALFGIAKGALLCALVTFFCSIANDKTRDFVNHSKSGPFFISVIWSVQEHFPDSELKRRFQELNAKNEEERASVNSIDAQVKSLKAYLTRSVLSSEASEIVNEADEIEERTDASKGNETSRSSNGETFFKSFASRLRDLTDRSRTSTRETTTTGTDVDDLSDPQRASSSKSARDVQIREPYDYVSNLRSSDTSLAHGTNDTLGEFRTSTRPVYSEPNYAPGAGNAATSYYANNESSGETSGRDYSSDGEFGFRSESSTSDARERAGSSSRRRSRGGRSASSARLGSYSYSTSSGY